MQTKNGLSNGHGPNTFDVIICGSGSAGLAAATYLSRYGIKCKILERRAEPMKLGQADGVQCRTVEIFESLGLAEDLLRQAYHVLEVAFWSVRENGSLQRDSRTADTPPGLSHQPHVILNQALVNKSLIGAMYQTNGQTIDYGYEIKGVQVDSDKVADPHAHCVTVVTEKEGEEKRFQGKYVLACDGAHSAVRKSLGFKMVGDSTNKVWGVMDVYPRTNFPDIRRKCVIHSAIGTLMIIPREGGSLARFYIELEPDTVAKDVTLDDLKEAARLHFAPYDMEITETAWWSAYSIGQRLADRFHQDHRVFLFGDACHTHSPKAGQGMNVSLQDGYNMGWKLGSVLTGQTHPDLLKTYVQERSAVAADLIEFDRNWTKLFSFGQSAGAITPECFSEQFKANEQYTAGLAACYTESIITKSPKSHPSSTTPAKNKYAKNLTVGMRMPSTLVVRHCDAKSMQLQSVLLADGRWRILIFPGKNTTVFSSSNNSNANNNNHHPFHALSAHLSSPNGPILSHPASHPHIDSFILPLLILSGSRTATEQDQIPTIFWPPTGPRNQYDLHRTFFDDQAYDLSHGHAYDFYGINEDIGAVVVVRPDQYVSMITGLDDIHGLTEFFDGFKSTTGNQSTNK